MAQVVRQAGPQHAEANAQCHLMAQKRPQGEAGAEHDAGGNEHSMKRDHAATLSRTISVNSAGKYRMETKKRRHARDGVAPTSNPDPAATYPIPSANAPKKYHGPVTPSTVGSRLIGSRAVA